MKKFLSIWGSVTLIGSSAVTAAVISSENKNEVSILSNYQSVEKTFSRLYAKEDWDVIAEGPRTTAERIGGVWRLEFNHELTQDIISGSATTSDILDIVSTAVKIVPGLEEKIGSSADIINAILKLGTVVLEKADQGNGVLIRFGGWVLPTKVSESTHDWN